MEKFELVNDTIRFKYELKKKAKIKAMFECVLNIFIKSILKLEPKQYSSIQNQILSN